MDDSELLDILAQAEREGDTATADEVRAMLAPKDPGGGYWNPQAPRPETYAGAGITDPRALAVGATRVATGVAQAGAGLGEAVTGANMLQPTTEAVKALEQKIMGGQPLTPDEEAAAQGMNMTLGAALPMAGAAKVVGAMRPTTLAKGIATAAGAGAAGGATQFDPNAQSPTDVLMGPLFGATTGGMAGLIPAGKGLIKNVVLAPFRKPPLEEAQARLDEIAASPLMRKEAVPLTRAQETGSYEAEVMEGKVAGSFAKQFYNRQQAQLASILNKWAGRAKAAPGRAVSAVGEDIEKALGSHRAATQRVASDRYGAQLEEAKALAAADIVDPVGMRVDNLSKFVQDKLAGEDFSEWGKFLDPISRREAGRVWELFQKVSREGGALGMADMMTLHQASNKFRRAMYEASGSGKVSAEAADAYRLGRSLADAIENDIDVMKTKLAQVRQSNPVWAASDAGKKYEAAWSKFEEARTDYRQFVKYRDEMDASVVNQLFGQGAKNPADAMDRLMRAEAAEQKTAVRILTQHAPETLADMKRYHLRTVANQMIQQTEEGAKSAVSPDALIKAITEDGRLVGSEFWSKRDIKDLTGIVAYARMIQNKAPVRSNPLDMESAVMAGVSLARAFLARSAWRILGQGNVEEFFFDPKKREALKVLATTNDPNNAAFQAAMGVLGEDLAEK